VINFDRQYISKTYPSIIDGDGWSFIIDDGWIAHVNKITDNIMGWISKFNSDYDENVTLKILQIKEKFGGLRYYYTLEGYDDMSDDHFNEFDKLRNHISDFVHQMEVSTYHICEICGMYGEVTKINRGWLKTLCLFHKSQYK